MQEELKDLLDLGGQLVAGTASNNIAVITAVKTALELTDAELQAINIKFIPAKIRSDVKNKLYGTVIIEAFGDTLTIYVYKAGKEFTLVTHALEFLDRNHFAVWLYQAAQNMPVTVPITEYPQLPE